MHNITVTVEKENEFGQMSFDTVQLTEIGGGIAHTVTPREPHPSVQHCNLVIEFRELKTMEYTEVKLAIDEQNMLVRSDTIGTLTTDGNSPKHNNRIAEVNKLGNVGEIITQGRSVFDKEGISPTLISGMSHGNTVPYVTEEKTIKIRQATEQGYTLCEVGGAADLDYPTSQTRRGRVIENGKICPTLTTENIPNVIELGNPKFYNFVYKFGDEWWLIRIRKLTPKECWRLMGFYDEDFEKAAKVNSNTQLYKQAGNSIVVNVLEGIFKQMI